MLIAPPYGLNGPRCVREQRVVRIRRPIYFSTFPRICQGFFVKKFYFSSYFLYICEWALGGAVYVTFLSRQESNQRTRHGRGAEFCAPAQKDALSYVPLPSRTWYPLEHLNEQNLHTGFCLANSGGSALAALPICLFDTAQQLPFGQKVGTLLARTGFRLRCSGSFVSARRKDSQRGRLLLVLFLAKQEKYIACFGEIK